jgi:hypothetical protein
MGREQANCHRTKESHFNDTFTTPSGFERDFFISRKVQDCAGESNRMANLARYEENK